MPKISRPRRRQTSLALEGWSSSDEDESPPHAKQRTTRKSRSYGPPDEKHAPSSNRHSEPLKLKKRAATPIWPRQSFKIKMRPDDPSDDDISLDDTEKSRGGHKVPRSESRASSATRFRRGSNERAPSYPASSLPGPLTPLSSRNRRRIIRVNLTPTRNLEVGYTGWRKKSQLKQVAKRHGGMAIQYRVMYHAATAPIRDYNAGSSRQIRTGDLVVQSRYACATGSSGGSTYSFMRWKLPGTLLTCRNAAHISIYDDTRPCLETTSETSAPLILVCSDLKQAHVRMVKRFLLQAKAGSTPEKFYSQANNTDAIVSDASVQGNGKDPFPVLQDDENGKENVHGNDREAEDTHVPSKRAASSQVNHNDKRPRLKNLDRNLRRELTDSLSMQHNRHKRKRGNSKAVDSADKALKRPRKKKYGGARHRRHETVEFYSKGPQCLALVEGVALGNVGSGSPDDAARDYIRDIYMNGRVEKLPQNGRLLELPGTSLPGAWKGEVVSTKGVLVRPRAGMMRDKVANLKDVRIALRHESAKTLGLLECTRRGDSVLPQSATERIHGGGQVRSNGPGKVTVSLIDPSSSRHSSLVRQGIIGREETVDSFVGSISLACFDGFTSSADASVSARKVSRSLLESCRNHAIDKVAAETGTISALLDILSIPDPDSNASRNVGISFVCKVATKESYGLLVAHDEQGQIVAIDVVFDKSLIEGRTSLSSISTNDDEPAKLTEGTLRRHAEGIDKAALEKALDTPSSTSQDDLGMIPDDDQQGRTSLSFDRVTALKRGKYKTLRTTERESDDWPAVDSNDAVTHPMSPEEEAETCDLQVSDKDDLPPIAYSDDVKAASNAPHVTPGSAAARWSKTASSTDKPTSVNGLTSGFAAGMTSRHVVAQNKTVASVNIDKRTMVRFAAVTPTPASVGRNQDKTPGKPFPTPPTPASRAPTPATPATSSSPLTPTSPASRPVALLARLERAVDKVSGPAPLGKDRVGNDCDNDEFQGALSYDFGGVNFSKKLLIDDKACNEYAVSRWPSIHDVFFGLHDEAEHVPCTIDDMQNLPEFETRRMNSLLLRLHEFFFGPDDGEDEEDTSSKAPLAMTRGTIPRRPFISAVRVFVIMFVLWQATLSGNMVDWTTIPTRAALTPAINGENLAAGAFGNDRSYELTARKTNYVRAGAHPNVADEREAGDPLSTALVFLGIMMVAYYAP